MSTAPFDIMPVLVGALLEERRHWRETATANISTLVRALEGDHLRPRIPGAKVPASAIRAELREWTLALDEALSGKVGLTRCPFCDYPVRPGELVIYFDDEGEAHAVCASIPADQLFDGGRMALAPDQIPDHGPGEAPHPGYVGVYASTALYTDAQILRQLRNAKLTIGADQ